jgi:hypothetical protein
MTRQVSICAQPGAIVAAPAAEVALHRRAQLTMLPSWIVTALAGKT